MKETMYLSGVLVDGADQLTFTVLLVSASSLTLVGASPVIVSHWTRTSADSERTAIAD